MKALVVPDVHLKPWMFTEATKILERSDCDVVVLLGDLVDDFNQQYNVQLYNETFDAVEKLARQFEVYWCYGNHDVSYLWKCLESGYSKAAEDTVRERSLQLRRLLPSDHQGFVLRLGEVVFSHAGLTESFVRKYFDPSNFSLDDAIDSINSMSVSELWNDDSPIWARPQYGRGSWYPGLLQVVGHSPLPKATQFGSVLSLDTFSTHRDGTPVGEQRFVSIDLTTGSWEYVN